MTVRVDELRIWPGAPTPFRGGACHLTADADEELHTFAAGIGLRRACFQPHRLAPHYALTPKMRARALVAGAVFVPALEQARERRGRPLGETETSADAHLRERHARLAQTIPLRRQLARISSEPQRAADGSLLCTLVTVDLECGHRVQRLLRPGEIRSHWPCGHCWPPLPVPAPVAIDAEQLHLHATES